MKRITALLLSFLMIISVVTTTNAAEIKNEVYVDKIGSKITKTEYNNVYISEDNQYFLAHELEGNLVLEPVVKIEMSVSEPVSIQSAVTDVRIPQEVREEIAMKYDQAIRSGNEELQMTLFSASLANVPGWGYQYHTYNGAFMKSELLVETGLDTGFVDVDYGSTTKETAANYSNILISLAGFIEEVACVSTGVSVLQAFLNLGNSYPTGHRDDYIKSRITYDTTKQWTYREKTDGTWALGLISQEVLIKKIETILYFYDNYAGTTETLVVQPNHVLSTPNFDDPWETAYDYSWLSNAKTEVITFQIYDRTFLL